MMLNKISIGLLTAMVGSTGYAAGYSTTQVSNQPLYNESPLINAQRDVVWSAATPSGRKIFLFRNADSSVRQLNNDNAYYNNYQINARGDVVWTSFVGTGSQQEVFLYTARTRAVTQISSGNYNPYENGPQLSNGGDVAWTAPQNTAIIRYDAATKVAAPLKFPNATLNGYPRINTRGDIVWNASVGGHSQILRFLAANKSIDDLSNRRLDAYANQQIDDRGDVVWNGSDGNGNDSEMYRYDGVTRRVTQLTNDAYDEDQFQQGASGDITWVVFLPDGTCSIELYRASTGQIVHVANEAEPRSVYPKINARGDVAWTAISGTTYTSNLYVAATQQIVQLTNTQNQGVFELALADNGDAAWSFHDGNDFEVFTYQASTGAKTQLTNNTVDDGIIKMNAQGSLVWTQFNPSDSQIIRAVKINN